MKGLGFQASFSRRWYLHLHLPTTYPGRANSHQEGPTAASKSQCIAGFSQPVGSGSLWVMRQVPPHLQNGAKGQGHKRKRWGCTRPSLRLGGGLVPTLHWLILRVPVVQRKTKEVFAKTDSHLGPQLLAGGKILGAWLYWWRQEGEPEILEMILCVATLGNGGMEPGRTL